MSFPTVYYITQVIPPCYTAGYECACVSVSVPVYIGVLVQQPHVICIDSLHISGVRCCWWIDVMRIHN